MVTPTLPGRLAWLAWELNSARHAADERLDKMLGQVRSRGAHASGTTGDDTVLTAFADAIAEFEPDQIVIALAQCGARELARAGPDQAGQGALWASADHLCG